MAFKTVSRRRTFSRRVLSISFCSRASSNRLSSVGNQSSTSLLKCGACFAARSCLIPRSIAVGSSSSKRSSSCLRRALYSLHLVRLSLALLPFIIPTVRQITAPIDPKEKAAASSLDTNAHATKAAAPRENRMAIERWRSAISSNSRSSMESVGLFVIFRFDVWRILNAHYYSIFLLWVKPQLGERFGAAQMIDIRGSI